MVEHTCNNRSQGIRLAGPDALRDLPDDSSTDAPRDFLLNLTYAGPVVAARASILPTTGGARGGLPMRSPRTRAAFIPAVTRSLISEDSSSAMAPMMVNIARPMGLSVST